MVKDNHKQKLINQIDNLKEHLFKSIHDRDLNNLRKKYIYKDISLGEFIKDVNYLKELKKLV